MKSAEDKVYEMMSNELAKSIDKEIIKKLFEKFSRKNKISSIKKKIGNYLIPNFFINIINI